MEFIAPQGHILAVTVADASKINVGAMFFPKCVSLHFELMFTPTWFPGKHTMRQSEILRHVAQLFDDKKLVPITAQRLDGGLTVANVTQALDVLKAGKSHGKIVLKFNGNGDESQAKKRQKNK